MYKESEERRRRAVWLPQWQSIATAALLVYTNELLIHNDSAGYSSL